MRIAIIGAGAAGCFAAIEAKRHNPKAEVTIFESGPRPMAKLSLTGGGRCNMTNSFASVRSLNEVYPRGYQLMKRCLKVFGPDNCREWFEKLSIASFTQDDDRVFPVCQDATLVVRAIERALRQHKVDIICNCRITSIRPGWTISSEVRDYPFDRVLVTTGGGAIKLLEQLELQVETPTPSLFTLKVPDLGLNELSGISVPQVSLSLPGTSFKAKGALLLTDWGISGPATLRISSYAALHLALKQYCCDLSINWLDTDQETARQWCAARRQKDARKMVSGTHPENLPERLWKHILAKAGLRGDLRWAEMGDKGLNRLCNALTADIYPVCGRARFKEEFVTAGGVSLKEIDPKTMQSRRYPGLFFAGEILDIDAITGGFNLQAAWSTAFVAAAAISEE